jgi:hypothetical protein
MMKTLASALCLVLLLSLPACQRYGGKGIPEELRGVWVSEAEDYERCSLEITGEKLIFENGVTFIDINYVKSVERATEGDALLYTFHYENREGEAFKLFLLYTKKEKGGMLCFKNQRNITWTKRVDA